MKKSLISILVLIMVLSSVFMLACKEPTEEVIPAPAPEGVEAESLGEYGKVTLSFGAFSDIHFSSVCDKQVKEYYPKALADIMKQTGNRLSARNRFGRLFRRFRRRLRHSYSVYDSARG